jgi:hypothetical protein
MMAHKSRLLHIGFEPKNRLVLRIQPEMIASQKRMVLRDQEATTYLPRRATAAGCDFTETGFPWLGSLRG